MIKSITAQNFQSWKDLHFTIEDGVTLINGFNYDDETSEGSGKSAILNALCWCIYGKLPKDAKIDEVIKEGEENCQVFTVFDKFTIYRSRSPNDLKIVDKVTKQVLKGKDTRETQKMIEELVGMGFDTFCQTIYFAQNYNKKFVTANQEDRGKILSEIQDLSVFDRAYKEAHKMGKLEDEKLRDFKHKVELRQMQFTNTQRVIQDHIKFAKQQQDQKAAQIAQIQAMLTNKVAEGETLQYQLEDFKNDGAKSEYEVDILELQTEVDKTKKELMQSELVIAELSSIQTINSKLIQSKKFDKSRIERLKREHKELVAWITDPTEICKACGTALEVVSITHAEQQIELLNQKIAELETSVKSIDAQLNEIQAIPDQNTHSHIIKRCTERLQKINTIILDLQQKVRNIELADIQYVQTTKMFEMVKADVGNIELQLKQAQGQTISDRQEVIHVLEAENNMIMEELNTLEALQKATNNRIVKLATLKAGFKEVKSYTFNSVLNELSRRANTYIQDLFEVPIALRFTNDNMKIELDIRIAKVQRSYGLFSGGQQRRISLAIDLALSDIVTSRAGSSINLLILDEPFQNLSEASMTKCLQLLERLGKPTLLIEHNSIFQSIVNRVVNIELRDGTSCITDFRTI